MIGFFGLPKEIIILIYSFDNTYKLIYDESVRYIKMFINKDKLYEYNDNILTCISEYTSSYIFIRKYSSYDTYSEKYIILPFYKAILKLKIYKTK
jgi:hypothetical protein